MEHLNVFLRVKFNYRNILALGINVASDILEIKEALTIIFSCVFVCLSVCEYISKNIFDFPLPPFTSPWTYKNIQSPALGGVLLTAGLVV